MLVRRVRRIHSDQVQLSYTAGVVEPVAVTVDTCASAPDNLNTDVYYIPTQFKSLFHADESFNV